MIAPLETQLARASSQGDLSALLMALEGADWAVPLADEHELMAALAELSGGGKFCCDPRLFLQDIARSVGFEPSAFEADWRKATVLLIDPDERAIKRAGKAEARLIADATLCPGSGWLARGADMVVYRNAGALTGHREPHLAVLMGKGEQPTFSARSIDRLSSIFVLRDLSSLSVRLARQMRAAETLLERLGDRAVSVSGAVLWLGEQLHQTKWFDGQAVIGGVISARRSVRGGTLLSVGLENVEDLWRDLELTQQAVEEPVEQKVAAVSKAELESISIEPLAEPAPDLPSVSTEPIDLTAGFSQLQLDTFERLRDWRNTEARKQEVSRFIVSSNATLVELARLAPQTEEELRKVRGMGPERIRKYAAALLKILSGVHKGTSKNDT